MVEVAALSFVAGLCISSAVVSVAAFGRLTGAAWFTLAMGLINLAAVVARLLA
jgi:hypothetical protein